MLVGTTFLTVVANLAIVLLPTHEPTPMLLRLMHHCWLALRHGSAPQWHEMTALALLGLVLLVAVQVGRGLVRYAVGRGRCMPAIWNSFGSRRTARPGRSPR